MSKAQTLATTVSTGSVLADGTVAYAEVSGTPTLAAVATSGSYTDLTDKPTILATATNIAGGSNGTIPYQTAADTTAMLAVGTAGQVLQTNGAGAPSWVTPAGGDMVLLSTVTASEASTVDVTGFSSTYDSFQIYVVNLTGTSIESANLLATLFLNSVEITTGYASSLHTTAAGATNYGAAAGATGAWRLSGTVLGPSNDFFSSVINLFNVNSAGKKTFTSSGIGTYGGANVSSGWGFLQTPATTVTGMRFVASSGGTLTGTFRLYGIAK